MKQQLDSEILTAIDEFARYGIEHPQIQYVASGKSGDVYQFGGEVAIKIFKQDSKYTKDPLILNDLSHIDGYPKLYSYIPNQYMVMEFVKGKTIYDIEGRENYLLKDYRSAIANIISETNARGIYPKDLHLNNIMIDERGKLYIVDVGRFTYKKPEKLLTHSLWWSSSSSSGFWSSWSSSWSSSWTIAGVILRAAGNITNSF